MTAIRSTCLAIILLAAPAGAAPSSLSRPPTIPVELFLDSIGVVTSFPDRGQPLADTIRMIRYAGFRWVRGGIEGLTSNGPTTVRTFLDLSRATGVKISWGLVSGGTDVDRLLSTGRVLATAGALLAFEGNNEPNNWGVVVDGVKGGGRTLSWSPVAELQHRLYEAVKADPALARYPVWSISEAGAQTDNVGLQFLTIPTGAGALMPAGTRYADAANLHNYPAQPASGPLPDNIAWNAADPSPAARADGVYGNYGETWSKHFKGYPQAALATLPRVTTETGMSLQGAIDEQTQGMLLLHIYLAQFARGFSYTSVYLLRDRTDEAGNQTFGFFRRDYQPRASAIYLHNLTTILARAAGTSTGAELRYVIPDQPVTVHDLLLRHASGGYSLLLWDERAQGEDHVIIRLGARFDVTTYDPTMGSNPIRKEPNVDHLDVTLTNHPLVLALSSASPAGLLPRIH